MDFSNPKTILIAALVSNLAGLLFLLAAIRQPRFARLLFFLLFSWASWTNYTTSHQHPELYLVYAQKSISLYTDFINGWFKLHITVFVSGIAFGQALIAIGMLLKGTWVKLACMGAIIFLLGIAPLGIYAAFPFPLIVAAAAYIISRKDGLNYLWRSTRSRFNADI